MVSPALSNSSIQEVSATNDNFSLTEDGDGKRVYLIVLARFHLNLEDSGLYRGESSERERDMLITSTLETRKISEGCT